MLLSFFKQILNNLLNKKDVNSVQESKSNQQGENIMKKATNRKFTKENAVETFGNKASTSLDLLADCADILADAIDNHGMTHTEFREMVEERFPNLRISNARWIQLYMIGAGEIAKEYLSVHFYTTSMTLKYKNVSLNMQRRIFRNGLMVIVDKDSEPVLKPIEDVTQRELDVAFKDDGTLRTPDEAFAYFEETYAEAMRPQHHTRATCTHTYAGTTTMSIETALASMTSKDLIKYLTTEPYPLTARQLRAAAAKVEKATK